MRRTRASRSVDAMMKRKVDLSRTGAAGEYPDLHEKLALELATEIHLSDPHAGVAISWAAQQAAQDYFNKHGFERSLDYMLELRSKRRARRNPSRKLREVRSETWATGMLIVKQPRSAIGLYTKDYPGFEMMVEELRAMAVHQQMKSAAMFDRYDRLVVQAYKDGRTRMGSRAALRGEKPR